MSKEIYKEYASEFLELRNSRQDRVRLNKQYILDGESFYELKVGRTEDGGSFVDLMCVTNLDKVTRKPKTQMINGHEVVAPRYDEPENGEQCYWLNLGYTQGFQTYDAESLSDKEKRVLKLNGWYDNLKNIESCVNAHRENKNE